MPPNFIATIFELADAGEIDTPFASRTVEHVIVSAAPFYFVGEMRDTLSAKINGIFLSLECNDTTLAGSIEEVSNLLEAVVHRREDLAELL